MITNKKVQQFLEWIKPEFTTHCRVASWGKVIYIMGKDGTSFARIVQENQYPTAIYLDSLSVNENCRKQGIGKHLQEIRENIGRCVGAGYTMLFVVKGSWMQEWYKRRGYVDYLDHETEENCIWMHKSLN